MLKGLLNLLKRIGRWIAEHIAEHGVLMLIGYMNGKVGDFRRRISRIEKFTKKLGKAAKRRIAWLQFRIKNWTSAIAWLKANAKSLTQTAIKTALRDGEVAQCPLDTEPGEKTFQAV